MAFSNAFENMLFFLGCHGKNNDNLLGVCIAH